jgi:outer membrane receptor protein involved in Fe transport
VTAESPLVDIEKSSFSSTYDADVLESLPTRRYTFFDMVQASPGLTPSSRGSSRVSSFGSGSEDNAYYIQGIDVSAPSTGAAWPWPMPDIIEEVEVTGVGASAEYGNFTGAVINVLSKSGSNTFHGAVKYFLQHDSLTGNNTPDEKWPFHRDHWHDAVFQLSGPIIKDKLWFFVSVQHQVDRSTGIGADPAFAPEYRMTPTIVGKIDFQLNKNNKFSLWAHYENYENPGMVTEYQPIESTSAEKAPAIAPTFEWLCMLSDNTYFEIKYGGFYTYLEWDPVDGDLSTPGHYDWATGYYSVNATGFYHWKTNRTQVNGSVTHYAQDFLQGNHEFKFGVQYSHGYSDEIWGYPGGVIYYDWYGYPYAAYFRLPSHYGGAIDQLGVFVDDTWEVTDRLTLNLGLRFDFNDGRIPDFDELDESENPTGNVIPGIPDVADWKNLSPRIGINYQLTPDRKTVFRASYGRYYNALIIGDFDNATPALAPLYAYGYDWGSGAYDDLWYVWNPLTDLGLDPNLKSEYTDQFSAALEREVLPNFSLSATFVYKKTQNIIGRTNTAAQYEEIQVFDEYSGDYLTVYDQLSPIQNFYLVTNNGDEMTYRGLMLVANKRLSNNYQLYASFTWSRAWYVPKGFTDKNSLVNGEGPTSRDRRWMVKFGGAYFAPFGIVLGVNTIWEQGSPWERDIRIRLNQGSRSINAEPEGSRRFPNHLYFDFKLEKGFKLYDRFKATISLDIINLFNMDTNLGWVSTRAESPSWMIPTSIVLPRRAILGVRLEF